MDEGFGGDLPRPTLSRLMALAAAGSKLRFRLRLACMELSTICHLRWRLARPHIPASRLICSLPSHSSHHPSKPHQIKQPLSKIAVNERAVGKRQSIMQKRWLGYLLYCKLLLYLQRGLATFRTDKGRPDIAFSGQYPIRPWTIANTGRWNNGSNVTPEFNYIYTIV